ncbi:hypothetical protein ACFL0M_01145 [Thermodesulfobacteriota bacterium]
MIHPAVFLLSFSSLAYEMLLTRIFSISQWNHLSFMVISIALFGFAASGTFLSILDTQKRDRVKNLSSSLPVSVFISLYTFTAIASLLILNRIPLDYFRLPLEPIQISYLLVAYLLLAIPFFFAGLVISIAYAAVPEKTAIFYFASMAGSAFGAIIPAPFLPFLGESRLIILAVLAPLILVPFEILKRPEKDFTGKNFSRWKQNIFLSFSLCIFFVAALLCSPVGKAFITVKPSSYKALSQTLQFPDTQITETRTSLHGRIDHVKSRYIRFAPGLSLKFSGMLPNQDAIFKDGDNPYVLYNLNSKKDAAFASFTLSYAGYDLNKSAQNVLVIQNGGGLGILCAMASGIRPITIVEQNPNIARIVRKHYGLPVINQNPRAFLSRSVQRFGIIHIENWGTSLPGSAALNQEHFFTIEAFIEYLNHLDENGIVIISRKLLLPPADSIRLWATAFESLRSIKIERPERHLAVLRNWDTFALIVSAKPFKHTAPIKDFALNKNFDLVYVPSITAEMTNRFNIFDEPYHFLEINRLAQAYRFGTEKNFFSAHPLDIIPQTDLRPFPSRFLKWTRLKEIYKSTGSRLYALLISGEIVVAVVLIEAIGISLILLMLPRAVTSKDHKKASPLQALYFLSVGSGFMFVEIYFIKNFVFLFSNPVISFTVVLAAILVFSGIGGFYTQKIDHQGLKYALIALTLVLVGIYFAMNSLTHRILALPNLFRYLMAILLMLPSGILMGLPFPIGMRSLLKNPYQRANAWALNGCASVLSSIIAAQIALSLGIPTIVACAALAYFIAFIIALKL